MIETLPVPTAVQAVLLIGIVLIEAVVLYVGYGYVEQLVGPPLLETIANS